MRTISDNDLPTAPSKKAPAKGNLETFSTTLKDGREIIIRDLVYMEKDLARAGDVEKGMKIIERLIVGDDKITYEEILDLGVRDFKKLSELVAKANGGDDEDPN